MTDHLPGTTAMPRRRTTSTVARIASRINQALVVIESALILVLLVALVVSVFTQVASRYVLNISSPWTEEAARYFFVWVSMLGASLGVQRHSHFGFDAVVRKLPPLAHRVAKTAALLVVLGMSTLILVQGWKLVELGRLETGSATNLPMVWVYGAIPVGGVLIVMHLVLSVFEEKVVEAGGDGGQSCC